MMKRDAFLIDQSMSDSRARLLLENHFFSTQSVSTMYKGSLFNRCLHVFRSAATVGANDKVMRSTSVHNG